MKLITGQVLQDGKYVLNSVLSQGGFGTTYRATHKYLAQAVVIKTLNDNLRSHADFERFQQRFIAEARLLARFQHPNIVRVSDFFKEEGLPFIVMDYIPGRTLAEVISDHPPTEVQAIRYMRQIGAALDVVHRYGLLHRDVKPQNIILRQGTQSVILIDFGIAREFTPGVTQTNTGLLSAGYAPIEQYLQQHRWTPATDVYALAATLYTLLTGQPPIASVLRDRIPLSSPRQLQPHLSVTVEQAILQGMALEANHRPQTVANWLALLPKPQKASTGQDSISLSVTSPTVIPTGITIPAYQSTSLKQGSKASVTAALTTPKVALSAPATKHSEMMPSLLRHPLHQALIVTSIIAAIAGGGLGLVLRSGGVAKPGFSPINVNESFPPREMPGTSLPTSPPSLPLPEVAPVEKVAPIRDQLPPSTTSFPVEPAPIKPIPEPESSISVPPQEVPSPTLTPAPELFDSISPTSEPTVDLTSPVQAPASAEPTPPTLPQVPEPAL